MNLRAEAVVGLARGEREGKLSPETRSVLLALLAGKNAVLAREALRSLRGFVAQDAEAKKVVDAALGGQ